MKVRISPWHEASDEHVRDAAGTNAYPTLPEKVLHLQQTAGNRAVTRALQSSPPSVQRSIVLAGRPAPPRFSVTGGRPGFRQAMKQTVRGQGQQLNHTIAYKVIESDLVKMLNSELTHTTGADWGALVMLTDSLYVNGSPAHQAMKTARTALHVFVRRLPHRWPTRLRASFEAAARSLLSHLNSAPANLRLGSATINQSMHDAIDADFLGTTLWFQGDAEVGPQNWVPPVVAPPAGTVIVPSPPGAPQRHNTRAFQPVECLRLVPAHEHLVFSYAMQSRAGVGFIVNGIAGVQHPAANNGQHLSSTAMPTVFRQPVPYPVLVMDRAQREIPFLFA